MPSLDPFPTGRWSGRTVTFAPGPDPPAEGPVAAVVVFAWAGCGWVLGDIEGRGWTVPSGRVEPGETPEEAARRETWEEVGGVLEEPRLVGWYRLALDDEVLWVPAFVGRVGEFGAIPSGSESRGARCVPPEELPAAYHMWDELLARLFEYARVQLDA